jgi:hypothetical protein
MALTATYPKLNAHPAALRQPMIELLLVGANGDWTKALTLRILEADAETSVVGPGNRATVKAIRPDEDINVGAAATLYMGYRGLGKWKVFSGWVIEKDNHIRLTIELQDASWNLEYDNYGNFTGRINKKSMKKWEKKNPTAMTAAAVVNDVLEAVGIAGRDLDLPAEFIKPYPMKLKTAMQHLKNAAKDFEIRYPFYFDLDQKFHWHPLKFPVTPIESLRYGVDYTNFAAGDEVIAEESEAIWAPDAVIGSPITLDTFLRPWLKAGDAVTLEDPRLSEEAAICVIEKATHHFDAERTGTALRMRRVSL